MAYCFIHAGHLRTGQARATLTGIGTGLVMGISDALTRRSVQILDAHSFGGLLTSWPPYCLLAAALIGMWLMQNSFNAAPLHASLPGITAAEPVAGILLGVVVFGDRINISPGLLALQAAGIAALVVGVIMVARSPRLGQLRPSAVIPDSVIPGLMAAERACTTRARRREARRSPNRRSNGQNRSRWGSRRNREPRPRADLPPGARGRWARSDPDQRMYRAAPGRAAQHGPQPAS